MGQLRQLGQLRRHVPLIGLKIRAVRFLGKALIPWADILANITPRDPAIQVLCNVVGKGFRSVFNGVVGNALGGIYDKRRNNSTRRTGIYAAGAGSAVIGVGRIGLEIEGRKNLPEEDPGAIFTGDDVAIFSDPTEARSLCPKFILDGSGVGVIASFYSAV